MIGVGDLVVCVDAFHWEHPNILVEGRAYTVAAISELGGLFMQEVAPPSWAWGGFLARRFRKILPDKHEACEDEFAILLKLSKQRVKA